MFTCGLRLIFGAPCNSARVISTATRQAFYRNPELIPYRKIATENPPPPQKTSIFKDGWKISLIFMGVSLIAGGVWFISLTGTPEVDSTGKEIPDEYTEKNTILAYICRSFNAALQLKKSIEEPTSTMLLPDPLRAPYYQPPYTLVIELTGVLLYPDWSLTTGWRFKKRPGLDYFLQQIAPPLFEIVIFTQESGMTAFPLIDAIDGHHCVMYRLFRDSTRYVKGKHIKDLSCLNRDLSKVIMIDWNEDAINGQYKNSFKLQKWEGDDENKTLFDLADFLKLIAMSNVDDIREVVEYYNQYDDPIEAFRDNQQRLKERTELAEFEIDKNKTAKPLYSKWKKR